MTSAAEIDVARLAARTGPYFGRFGGRFVPEALVAALDELDAAYQAALEAKQAAGAPADVADEAPAEAAPEAATSDNGAADA